MTSKVKSVSSLFRHKSMIAFGTLAVVAAVSLAYKMNSGNSSGIKTFKVVRKDITSKINLPGKIKPLSSVAILPARPGTLIDLLVREGDSIKAGQKLYSVKMELKSEEELVQRRLQVTELQNRVSQNEQRLREKEAVRDLISKEAWTQEELNLAKAKTDLKAARYALQILEREMGFTSATSATKTGEASSDYSHANNNNTIYVTSPIDGIVTSVDKRPGDYIDAGASGVAANTKAVVVVADVSQLLVNAKVNEADIRYIKNNQPVLVRLAAFPNQAFAGTISRIGGQGKSDRDGNNTYIEIEATLREKAANILPEMNAYVEITTAAKQNVLTLPISAVVMLPKTSYVQLATTDTDDSAGAEKETGKKSTQELTIETGVINQEEVEIISGLSEGQAVREIDYSQIDLSTEKPEIADKPSTADKI